MLLASQGNKAEFQSLVPQIQQCMYEWRIIFIRAQDPGTGDLSAAAQIIQGLYATTEGALFVSGNKIIMMMHDEQGESFETTKSRIAQKLPGKGYRFIMRQMTGTALQQITANFPGTGKSPDSLFSKRQDRKENRVLVIDDDDFYRAVLKKACEKSSTVYQSEDGKNATQLYQEINPDIVFLDIHLPLSYGFLILEDFLNVDFDAFVIMISSDSSSQNVAKADDMGGSGFLKKPLDPEELQRIFESCSTWR
jgi:two-component system chemotaxis response regulator CheY